MGAISLVSYPNSRNTRQLCYVGRCAGDRGLLDSRVSGVLAALLATLSLITRRLRHPLLIIGLAAFGIMFIGYRFLERAATEQAWAVAQATEIVAGRSLAEPQVASIGAGAYTGLVASAVLVLFGLTIVFRRAANPYPEPEDDDV